MNFKIAKNQRFVLKNPPTSPIYAWVPRTFKLKCPKADPGSHILEQRIIYREDATDCHLSGLLSLLPKTLIWSFQEHRYELALGLAIYVRALK